MDFDESVRYLYSLGHETLALKLGLKTTQLLLNALHNPEGGYPSVQIAGTNGKGSTAVVLDSICRAAGIKTGLYTSPHLSSITERIRIGGCDIDRNQFASLATKVRSTVEQLIYATALSAPPTFFEHVTAMALLAFKEEFIQLAILETGLGGRLDSTTAAQAGTVAITPISLDHQEYLGKTLEEIAAEKAAIIRAGVTAVIAPQDDAVNNVILQRCAEVSVTPEISSFETEHMTFTAEGRAQLTLRIGDEVYPNLYLGLRGRHQIINVALAIEIAESLRDKGFEIDRRALSEGVAGARHPGRLELITGEPSILFDGAHNAAGARALAAYLDEFAPRPVTIVFGAMMDKDLSEMSATLFPKAHALVLTAPDNPRA
ncbi:MAG TPA: Mur ligase family protein, partial [Pyrinomonadaceae bacterium]|nr:Mur ligase family protein [Pyrinomonadaceae bacterium]